MPKHRTDGRDARGRFLPGGRAARECGRLGYEAAIESIIERHPDAINALGNHIATTFMWWVNRRNPPEPESILEPGEIIRRGASMTIEARAGGAYEPGEDNLPY